MDDRAWVVSCVGEPAAEIEDALQTRSQSPSAGQVPDLACAELSRTWDECRAESRPLGKREIAVVGRREHDLALLDRDLLIRRSPPAAGPTADNDYGQQRGYGLTPSSSAATKSGDLSKLKV